MEFNNVPGKEAFSGDRLTLIALGGLLAIGAGAAAYEKHFGTDPLDRGDQKQQVDDLKEKYGKQMGATIQMDEKLDGKNGK